MIVVIGSPVARLVDGVLTADGAASQVALSAAATGRTVQLVGRTGDDATADGVVLDLTRGGVGHVALLRDPARATPLETPSETDDGPEATDPSSAPKTAAGRGDPVTTSVGSSLDAADVDLGLRYLTDFAVVVLAEPAAPDVVGIAAEAARWGGARLILVVEPGEAVPDGLPADVIVFEAPDADPDGVFAALVGRFAAALDDGADPGEAFRASLAWDGWTGAADD
ncbi:MAG: hypothetical protein A2Z32_14660 [Chloroflexi bacterium RBG_16_69_14]|nr:MAG: hypothetical protein A2Z32_14660 [Chloroflexi bacterium RBG_16_69_14]